MYDELTQVDIDKMKAELEDRRLNIRPKIMEDVKTARAFGDLSENYEYKAAKEDPYRLKKKSVRGGSWKDPESYIRSAWRTWEYQNQPRSYIGFRCVRSLASSSSTKQKASKKKK